MMKKLSFISKWCKYRKTKVNIRHNTSIAFKCVALRYSAFHINCTDTSTDDTLIRTSPRHHCILNFNYKWHRKKNVQRIVTWDAIWFPFLCLFAFHIFFPFIQFTSIKIINEKKDCKSFFKHETVYLVNEHTI